MYNPIATYRLQFNKEFSFADFEKVINYLQKLGVSTIYASPAFESVPGSTHGYDGVDPNRINPKIGTEEQLNDISKRLHLAGLGWLQDIVPNHMGVHPNNLWLMDVLEKGRQSLYASFFDTSLSSQLFDNEQLIMPFLGGSLPDVINNKELKIAHQNSRLVFMYFDNTWPLNLQSYTEILNRGSQEKISSLTDEIEQIIKLKDNNKLTEAWDDWLIRFNNVDKESLNNIIYSANNNAGFLLQLAKKQFYRLCSFKETNTEINYRRFFTVNSLMCINIQQPEVFTQYHKLIKKLIDQGVFNGLRIDHIDGLYDPHKYLQELRELSGYDTYIIAEKILEQGEELPVKWPLQGTSGYDFLAQVNNLLTDGSSAKKYTDFYQQLIGDTKAVPVQIIEKKTAFLNKYMQGELNNLLNYFIRLKLADNQEIKKTGVENLKKAIGYVLVYCPVYRYYGNRMPLSKDEAESIRNIFKSVTKDHEELKAAVQLLENVLLIYPYENDSDYSKRALLFYQRLMQFSGPLMAKGVEDTLMYTYNRFIGHNEVGDAPNAFGLEVKNFHLLMKQKQKQWPLALNATSTHDTKRGEDARARLNALTAMPGLWFKVVKHWQKTAGNLWPIPGDNDKYFIYQTIVGSYPMPGENEDDFPKRLAEYLTKALREAKIHSDYISPNEDYEKATLNFAAGLLDKQSEFWQSYLKIQNTIADNGIINSLVQVMLKFTCPGVPDVYQGCELWDFSLVDPDNRRPVDYELREKFFDETLPGNASEKLTQLWENRYNGHIKLWLTQQLFKIRRLENDLFAKGDYIPLKVKGSYKDNVIAFARRYQNRWIVVAAPLYTASITADPIAINWKDTRVILPAEAPVVWHHVFSDSKVMIKNEELSLNEVFNGLPLALLKAEQPFNNRGAGILMHITSLPSNFGIGDMGPGAKTFANFLSRGGQKYWQLLPVNPVSADQSYSPYSALSSIAGNTLLISPVLLARDGLLNESDLNDFHLIQTDKVNFTEVEDTKQQLFDTAYNNFQKGDFKQLNKEFAVFCKKEAYWLNDFALYQAIKDNHDGQPWYNWNDDLKLRNAIALENFKERHPKTIDEIKWLQFMFFRQWYQLKDHCKSLNIKLFGDLPFYVSYDSADVWANQNLFALDKNGHMTSIAGVPPDYFNADGQLWGMPVYNWDAMKQSGYKWWIDRFKKNTELFDLLRLDHFRAFASYWEVPAGETTAKNGQWQKGPGNEFFDEVKNAVGNLPFVAEDLGDIDENVFKLRDEFGLPGMKVLQFAFGNEMPSSHYIPHNFDKNFFVYTGTHDNNTILGWYDHDADKSVIKQLSAYTGVSVKRKNVVEILTKMAYASTANTCIITMQDLLKLDQNSRMNSPASVENNWQWQMLPKLIPKNLSSELIELVKMYNRL